MCSDPLNPGREVRGCCVGCILGMPEITILCLSQQATSYVGFLELKKCFFKRGCFGFGEIFWCSDWHEIVIFVSAPFGAGLNVMPHTASGR